MNKQTEILRLKAKLSSRFRETVMVCQLRACDSSQVRDEDGQARRADYFPLYDQGHQRASQGHVPRC